MRSAMLRPRSGCWNNSTKEHSKRGSSFQNHLGQFCAGNCCSTPFVADAFRVFANGSEERPCLEPAILPPALALRSSFGPVGNSGVLQLLVHSLHFQQRSHPCRKQKQGNRQFTDFPVFYGLFIKAADWSRTSDLRFTKASLCQLSYGGG